MWQAALVLVGVVVGGAIAGGMALRQEQRMVVHLHGEAVNIEEKTGHWPPPRRLGELPASFDEQFACVQGLRARVFDDALRRLVAEVASAALGALHAAESEGAVRLMDGLSETNEQLQERVHAALKELF
jgi:hypothetical protein